MARTEEAIDNGAATIIVDRCVPPDGLDCAPSTLKAVLWCLRGLGAPGMDIAVPASVLERRTCLSERAVRKAIAALKAAGVLEQIKHQAPGRPATYRMDYVRLADWLDPDDRSRVRVGPRTPAPDAGEHRHQMPENTGTTCRSESNTGTTCTQHRHLVHPTPAPDAGVPIRIAGASCKRPAEDLQQQQHAAAAAEISLSEWEDLGRFAKLEPALAAQCASELARRRWGDREAALTALERLGERMATEGVRNPVGLFVTILTRPGGPEPSQRSIKRAKADAKRVEYVARLSDGQLAELARRVAQAVPGSSDLVEGERFVIDLAAPEARPARERIWAHWSAVERRELAHA